MSNENKASEKYRALILSRADVAIRALERGATPTTIAVKGRAVFDANKGRWLWLRFTDSPLIRGQ